MRLHAALRRLGRGRLEPLEVWGSTEERERWIERNEAHGPKQLAKAAGAAVKGSRVVCVRERVCA